MGHVHLAYSSLKDSSQKGLQRGALEVEAAAHVGVDAGSGGTVGLEESDLPLEVLFLFVCGDAGVDGVLGGRLIRGRVGCPAGGLGPVGCVVVVAGSVKRGDVVEASRGLTGVCEWIIDGPDASLPGPSPQGGDPDVVVGGGIDGWDPLQFMARVRHPGIVFQPWGRGRLEPRPNNRDL